MTILDRLKGPTEEEIINNFEGRPQELLEKSCEISFYNCVVAAISKRADVSKITDKALNFLLAKSECTDLYTVIKERNPKLPELERQINVVQTEDSNIQIMKLLLDNGLQISILISRIIDYKSLTDDCLNFWWILVSNYPNLLTSKHRKNLFVSASEKGDIDKMEKLYSLGISPKYLNEALCQAAYHGKLNSIIYLVNLHADIHHKSGLALANAVSCHTNDGHIEVIEYLLNNGVDATVSKNKYGSEWSNIRDRQVRGFLEKKSLIIKK